MSDRTMRVVFMCAVVASALTIGVLTREFNAATRALNRHELCVEVEKLKTFQRQDKTGQLAQSEKFLKLHPHGVPGISRKLILEGEVRLRRQIIVLAPHQC